MSSAASLTGLPLATDDDILNANASFGNYAEGADTLLIPRYASTTARDAANTSGVTEGQMCVTNGSWQQYDGTKWWDIDHGSITLLPTTTLTTTTPVMLTSIAIKAGVRYDIESMVFYNGTTSTSDLSLTYALTGGAPGFNRCMFGPSAAATSSLSAQSQMRMVFSGTAAVSGTIAGVLLSRYDRLTVVGGSSDGTIDLMAAMNTLSGTIAISNRSFVDVRRAG